MDDPGASVSPHELKSNVKNNGKNFFVIGLIDEILIWMSMKFDYYCRFYSFSGADGVGVAGTFFGLSLDMSSRFSPNALWRSRTKLLDSGIEVIPPTAISNPDNDIANKRER